MSTTSPATPITSAGSPSASTSAIAALLDVPLGLEQQKQGRFSPHWRAIKIVWYRELLRVRSDRTG